jgi:O-antigen ligase
MVTLVLFSAILGARTILRYESGDALVQSDGSVRALGTGIFGDPNDLALAMAMALPLALGFGLGLGRAAHQALGQRLLCLSCVPVFIWTIYVTDSRGGMLALAAALFLYFRRRLGRWGVILGAMAVLVLMVAGPSRMNQMNAQEESAAQRLDAWDAGLQMLRMSPLWGVGKGMFTEYHYLTAHNSLVLCLAELGVLGTAAWLGLFYFNFRDTSLLRRQGALAARGEDGEDAPIPPWNRTAILQISLITFLIGGFFISRTYTPPLFVYLALSVAAVRTEAERAGFTTPSAGAGDWLRLAGLALGSILLIVVMLKVL